MRHIMTRADKLLAFLELPFQLSDKLKIKIKYLLIYAMLRIKTYG